MKPNRNVKTRGPGYFTREKTAVAQVRMRQFFARTGEMILSKTGRKRIDLAFLENLPRTKEEIEAEVERLSGAESVKEAKIGIANKRYGGEVLEILRIIRNANKILLAKAGKAFKKPKNRRTKDEQKAIDANLKSNRKIRGMCATLIEKIRIDSDYASEEIRRKNIRLMEEFAAGMNANNFVGTEKHLKKNLAPDVQRAKIEQERNVEFKRTEAYNRTLEALGERRQLTPRDLARLYVDLLESDQIALERKSRAGDTRNRAERIQANEAKFRRDTASFINWTNERSWTDKDYRKAALKAEHRGFELPPSVVGHLPKKKARP